MKGIEDYFSGPNKITGKEIENLKKSPTEMKEQSMDKLNESNRRKRKERKKKKRKHSDPEVRDVAQLLSNNLTLVSPSNTSKLNCIPLDQEVVGSTTKENKLVEIGNNELIEKKNAFLFMMESRNRVSGSHSQGTESNSKDSENDQKFSTRRQILANLSERKGSLKRKLEENNEIIDQKLKAKTKRLKKPSKIKSKTNKSVSDRMNGNKEWSSSDEETSRDFEKFFEVKNKNKIMKGAPDDEVMNKKCTKGVAIRNEDFDHIENTECNKNLSASNTRSENIDEHLSKDEENVNLNIEEKFLISDKVQSSDLNENNTLNCREMKDKKNTVRCRYKKRKEKNKKPDDDPIGSLQGSVNITSKTLRAWRMKIKLHMDNNISTETDTIKKENICIAIESSDELSEASNVLDVGDDECQLNKTPKKPVKIAPIFTKGTPKPKEDPVVANARKEFLMSRMPLSLKKASEKQISVLEQSYMVPTSHVQQKSDSRFWNLSQPELKLCESPIQKVTFPHSCEKLSRSSAVRKLNIDTEIKKVQKVDDLLNKIKLENPDYPVYKSFRQIHEKSGNQLEIEPEARPKKHKRGGKRKSAEIKRKNELDPMRYAMWTEKYKPRLSDDIIGNANAIKNIKKWLENWKYSESTSRKRKKNNDSESEFETIDSDSRDSARSPGKILTLAGPCGSGKSSAVYAICNELGFNVIELNASSKRTGKRLMQEIQEATQSHQVRKNESQIFQNLYQPSSQTNESGDTVQQSNKKLCVLLVEDIDIVFEQDDGFVSALLQLATHTKRPIIVTTSMQKFFDEYECISFSPLSSHSLSVWLRIVSLCEGLFVSQSEIGSLLEYNGGDVRKTLLQLQFWVQSGGEIIKDAPPVKIEHDTTCDVIEHKNCFRSFEILEVEDSFKVPFNFSLGLLWWNIPYMLDIPNFSKRRTNKQDEKEKAQDCKRKKIDKLFSITKVYDSMAFADVTGYYDGAEPSFERSIKMMDSLELGETFDCKNDDSEFVRELTHTLVDGCVKMCVGNDGECKLDIGVPDKCVRRRRTRLREYEDAYREALMMSTERKSTALDYMPVLRTITVSENDRATNNTKRGKRFRNYLRDLNVNCSEMTIKTACNILNSGSI